MVNSKPCGGAVVLLKFFSFSVQNSDLHDCGVGDFQNSVASSLSRDTHISGKIFMKVRSVL